MADYFTRFSCLLDVGTPDKAARAYEAFLTLRNHVYPEHMLPALARWRAGRRMTSLPQKKSDNCAPTGSRPLRRPATL